MMRNKRNIVYFLMMVSAIMLIVPLIPHHHHSNGIICMKDDLKDIECPCHHQHHHQNDDPCCTNDCMTNFESSVPIKQSNEIQPQYVFVAILFTESLLHYLTPLIKNPDYSDYVYRESLHSTYITRAAGLRAPPSFTV